MSNDRSPILPISSEQPDLIAGKHVESSSTSRQQRLLRLRNERLSARSLPIHGFTSRLPTLSPTAEEDRGSTPPSRNQENIAFPKPRLHGKHYHSTSSLGILDEISNSIKSGSLGRRTGDKRGPIPIFQDTPERALLDPSPYSSPLFQTQESSPNDSPLPFRNIQDSLQDMGLREVSGNVRKASASDSPGLGHIKPGRRQPTVPFNRSSSEEYIQRIERELELANDSVYSPNTNRSWKDKLRATQAENERLRQELADTKGTFEAEVQKAVQHKTAAEVVLRRKIKVLEDEALQKDCLIRDLELKRDDNCLDQHTVDTLRATIDRLESEKAMLEKSNETMSKRNEVLTHLLALSPTKTQQTFDLQTPSRASKSNRPRSLLLPRVSSSPTHTHPHRPQSLVSSPASARDFSPVRESPSSPLASETSSRFPIRPDHIRAQSSQQAGATHSRSSTLASVMSPTSENRLSSASSIDQCSRRASSRGPRRYLPGSTQLKPLLLPTLSGEFGALNSTSPIVSPSKSTRRDFTDDSLDRTAMFLSRSPVEYESELDDSQNDTDVARSRTSARQLAYQSLEGVLDADTSNGVSFQSAEIANMYGSGVSGAAMDQMPNTVSHSPALTSASEDLDRTILPANRDPRELLLAGGEDLRGTTSTTKKTCLSLSTRQHMVEIPRPLFASKTETQAVSMATTQKPSPVTYSRKRRKVSSSSMVDEHNDHGSVTLRKAQVSGSGKDELQFTGVKTPPGGSRPSSLSLLSPRNSRGPLELLSRRNFGVRPIAVVTIKTIYGTLSRCTAMLRDFKRDPLAIARRVIANAWRCNWAVLGKLSWWVLGLFLGPSAKTSRGSGIEWDNYDAEAIADRQCRRKSRLDAVEQQSVPPGGIGQLTDRHVRFDAGKNARKSTESPQNKPGWGKSVMLWAKFSTAIMLAVGGAVVKGPGEMLKEPDSRRGSRTSRHLRSISVSSKTSDLNESSAINIETRATPPPAFGGGLRRRRTRRQSLCSSPPSARALLSAELDAGVFSSSPPVSSSPAIGSFRFGRGQTFDFDVPDPENTDADTLKPLRPSRVNIEDIFDYSNAGTPARLPNGNQEYDIESAGLGRWSMASTPDSLR